MPCDTIRRTPEQTAEDRKAEIARTVARLQAGLAAGQVSVVLSPTGAVAFAGWSGQDDRVTDLCAFRRLQASNSPELRKALARAEVTAGRSVSQAAIGSGLHSHDGGKTWGRH